MKIFYEGRKTSFRIFMFSCLLVLGILIVVTITNDENIRGIVRVMTHMLPPFIISLNYKSSLTKRFVVATCSYAVLAAAANLSYLPFFFFYQFFSLDFSVVTNAATILLNLLLVLLLSRFDSIRKISFDSLKFWWPAMVIPILHIIDEILQFVYTPGNSVVLFLRIINSTFFWHGTIFLIFFLYHTISSVNNEKLKSELATREREYYYTQCALMQESVDKMKEYRHDVKLHLAALKNFTADNKEAENYLDNLLGGVEKSEVYSDTGNIAFDSIINFKLKDVLTNHINLQLKIFVPPALNIEIFDVVTILGNLLDNAFEAVANNEDKMIRLNIEVNKGVLFIKVDNTYDGIVKYANNTDDTKSVIATRKDSTDHGYGLKSIQKSVDKYDGQMDISHDENMFSVGILLYVGDV